MKQGLDGNSCSRPTGQAPTGLVASRIDQGRMAMFLEILGAAGGEADASDCSWNWINAFCEEHEKRDPDTFNQAIDAGYVDWSHDSDNDRSTIRLTDKGRAKATEATNGNEA